MGDQIGRSRDRWGDQTSSGDVPSASRPSLPGWSPNVSPPCWPSWPRSPSASTPPDTGCTWSAAPCATCSSAPTPPDRTSTSPPTPGRPRSAGRSPDGPTPCGPRASAFGTIGARRDRCRRHRPPLRDHHVPRRGVPRRLAQAGTSRSPTTIEDDLARRDFTINAMALELTGRSAGPALVDPHGGAADLAAATSAHAADRRRSASATTRCGCCAPPGSSPASASSRCRSSSTPSCAGGHRLEIVSAERIRDELDKLIIARSPGGRAVVPRRHRPRRSLPARAAGAAPRARPDPPPQGRAQPHDRRRRERRARPTTATFDFRITRLAALFHDIGKPRTRGYQPGKGTTFHHHDAVGARIDAQAHGGAALLGGRHRRGLRAGGPAPALPHLQDGVERLGGAPLRARRRRLLRRAQRADALRLHDPQRAQGGPSCRGGWTSWRCASPSWRRPRSWRRSDPSSTAPR